MFSVAATRLPLFVDVISLVLYGLVIRVVRVLTYLVSMRKYPSETEMFRNLAQCMAREPMTSPTSIIWVVTELIGAVITWTNARLSASQIQIFLQLYPPKCLATQELRVADKLGPFCKRRLGLQG